MLGEMMAEAAQAARAASTFDFELAEEAQWKFNVTYCAAEHLARVLPALPENERWEHAEEIAAMARRGEDVATTSRRWAQLKLATELLADKLDEHDNKNDTGNGELFAQDHWERFKFLVDREVWVGWDGCRWCDTTEAEIHRAAKFTAKRILGRALKDDDKELYKHAHSTLSRKGISNMVALASSEKIFAAKMKHFDRNPDLLNVANGTVDLRTGKLYPHDRDDAITTLTPISYDPRAQAPRWEQFVYEIFNGDKELVSYIQRAVGYSMTAHTREHAFFILWGTGRNGKGRFVRQLSILLGDAARVTRFQTFMQTREDSGNTPSLAALAGARLVTAGEPDEGMRLSESVIKSLTGEDEIEVCRKHEHPFTYIPTYKIWLHCNHKPQVRGTDIGLWSRPRLIPFICTFKTAEEAAKDKLVGPRFDPDKKLDDKLDSEREGILAWAVRGAMMWYEQGLGSCGAVRAATEEYREESDRLKYFIEECIETRLGSFVEHSKVVEIYDLWCRKNLVDKKLEGQTLSKQLVQRGFQRGKNEKDERGFKNIALKPMPGMPLFAIPGGAKSGDKK